MDESTTQPQRLDLLGIPCPVNWARARTRLETMAPRSLLEIVTDDPHAARDIPVAAEAAGYSVIDVETSPGAVRILIER